MYLWLFISQGVITRTCSETTEWSVQYLPSAHLKWEVPHVWDIMKSNFDIFVAYIKHIYSSMVINQ